MRICAILLILLSLVNNNAFAQGTAVLSYGYPSYQPYYMTPVVPAPYVVPVIATGHYAVPVTSYQYVPYQYIAGRWVYYPENINMQYLVVVERGGCFAPKRYFQNYSHYYYR